jgi:hypothetical protein
MKTKLVFVVELDGVEGTDLESGNLSDAALWAEIKLNKGRPSATVTAYRTVADAAADEPLSAEERAHFEGAVLKLRPGLRWEDRS